MAFRFGLIGIGRFGKNYARVITQNPHAKLVAVCSKTKKTLNDSKKFLPKNTIATTDPFDIIESKEIDCIIIATPSSTHFELARKTIENEKHVLCEKPMAINLSQAISLNKILQKSDRTFMVGHQFVYNDYINYLKTKIKNNFLGKTRFAIAQHFYPGPIREDIGCLWDAGTHQLSVLQHIFSPGQIVHVNASSNYISSKKKDDFSSAEIKFENGLTALLSVCWLFPEKTRNFVFIGDKKTTVFDDVVQEAKLKFFPTKSAVPKNALVPKIVAKEPLQNELNHFIDCVKTKKEPLTGIQSSLEITRWLSEISKKARRNYV